MDHILVLKMKRRTMLRLIIHGHSFYDVNIWMMCLLVEEKIAVYKRRHGMDKEYVAKVRADVVAGT